MRLFVPIAANQFFTFAIGVAGFKLVSEFVPPALNGDYGRFITLTQIAYLITHAGVLNHATRYWQRESAQASTYARFIWETAWAGMKYLLPLLLILAVMLGLKEGRALWIWAVPLLLICNLATALQMIAFWVLNAARTPWRVLHLNAAASSARVLLPIGLALATTMSLWMLGWGYTAHGLLIIGILLFMFRGSIRAPAPAPETRERWTQELKDYGRPFVLMGIGTWLLQWADRWIVDHFFGGEEAGFFVYATNMGAIIPTLAVGALMQFYFPMVFRKSDDAQSPADWLHLARLCDRVTGLFLVLSLSGLFCLTILGPYLVGPIIDPSYLPALDLIWPAGLAMVTVQINQFYYLLLQGQHDSVAMAKVMLVVAGIKTVGCVIAAAISWPVYLTWLIVSVAVSGVIGRTMIRRFALGRAKPGVMER